MTVRSTILARALVAASGNNTLTTVPAGRTYLLKTIALWNYNASSQLIQLWVGAPDGSVAAIYYSKSVPAATGDLISLWIAALPGDLLRSYGALGNYAVHISGSNLLGTAS